MKNNILISALLLSFLSVGVGTVNNTNGLEVRDLLQENYTNKAEVRVVVKRATEVANNNLSDVKAQISSLNDNGTRHIRFVAALDSYLYENVSFTITANNGEETRTLVDNEAVTTAYISLIAAGETLTASDAFGDGYNYFVAYTINNVPESAWDYTFSATVTAKAEGYSETVSSSADRVINDMANEEIVPVTRDVRYEGENCVVADGTSVKVLSSSVASNGYFAGGFDNLGQGLHFVHYSPVAGEFVMEVGYWTAYANSKHDVFVDGVNQGTVYYTKNTGWGNATNASPAETKTITINLKAGYNNITIIKNGLQSDNPTYGGWAQIDYLEIKGGVEYDASVNVDKTLNVRIEAELGFIHSGAYLPVPVNTAGNGYIAGEINETGHGVDFNVKVPESGTYELRIVYGKDDGARPININFDGTNYTYSLENYEGQAWNSFHTSDVAATLTLEAGTIHNLSVTRAENSNWFCFDAIILTKVA